MRGVWVLTREVNDYDQHGAYFVAVFGCKPTHEQLTALEVPTHRLRHVLNGGGRIDSEYEWFNLESHLLKTPNDQAHRPDPAR